jgi:imidazolonepropionase-like amidohydrolase
MGETVSRRQVLAGVAMLPLIAAVGCTDRAERPSRAQTTNTLLIRGVRVFDGERVIDADSVAVERGVITAVGRNVAAPAGVFVHDGGGRMLLPGLIDSHVHTTTESAALALPFGVTTMIDMFTTTAQLPLFRRQRGSTERVNAADVWSAGILVTAPGGHGSAMAWKIPTLSTDADPGAFVRARLDEGSDFIKIVVEDGSATGRSLPTLTAEQVDAVVAAAHAAGARTAVHVSTAAGAAIATAAGADLLAHAPWQTIDEPVLDRMRRQDMAVVATLAVIGAGACTHDAAALADDPRIAAHLATGQGSQLTATTGRCFPELLDAAMRNVAALHRAGVPVLAGTDAPNLGTTYGASLHEELDLLVRAGLMPTEALTGATALPASRFGLTDRGRVVAGGRADLLLVDGDPTRRITDTRNINAVWKNGYPVF